MSAFAEQVFKIFFSYKAILKKHASQAERAAKMNEIGLTKNSLTAAHDVELYRKIELILNDIEMRVQSSNSSASWYCGLTEFYNHLQKFLEDYFIDGDRVCHAGQQASRALLEAVQILRTPGSRLTHMDLKKAERCGRIISQLGNREQKTIYANALNRQMNPGYQIAA